MSGQIHVFCLNSISSSLWTSVNTYLVKQPTQLLLKHENSKRPIRHWMQSLHRMWQKCAQCYWLYNLMPCALFTALKAIGLKDHSFLTILVTLQGTAVAQWLRCCATNREVAGSISDGVIGIFQWHNPSDRTMSLGSTQPLTEMSTRRISWG